MSDRGSVSALNVVQQLRDLEVKHAQLGFEFEVLKKNTSGHDELVRRVVEQDKRIFLLQHELERLAATGGVEIDLQKLYEDKVGAIEDLRLQLDAEKRHRQKIEEQYDNFVAEMDEKARQSKDALNPEKYVGAAAIDYRVQQLMDAVRTAMQPTAPELSVACFLCQEGYSYFTRRAVCEMCKETFCGQCCQTRENLPGQTASRKLCTICTSSIMATAVAKRALLESPKERELNAARAKELRTMQDLGSGRPAGGEPMYYIIHNEWLDKWKAWVKGGERPSEIDNSPLLDRDKAAKPHLLLAEDYRALSEREWDYLFHVYGGGPPIRRERADIYSPIARPTAKSNAAGEEAKRKRDAKKKKAARGGGAVDVDEDSSEREERALAAAARLTGLATYDSLAHEQHDKRLERLPQQAVQDNRRSKRKSENTTSTPSLIATLSSRSLGGGGRASGKASLRSDQRGALLRNADNYDNDDGGGSEESSRRASLASAVVNGGGLGGSAGSGDGDGDGDGGGGRGAGRSRGGGSGGAESPYHSMENESS